jgi:hypothetical protein
MKIHTTHNDALKIVRASAQVVFLVDLAESIAEARTALQSTPSRVSLLDATLWQLERHELEANLATLQAAFPLWLHWQAQTLKGL